MNDLARPIDSPQLSSAPSAGTLARSDDVADAAAAEQRRLQHELDAARRRIAAARAVAEGRLRASDELLRTELEASRALLADIERNHQEALAVVRAAAGSEIDRILSEARSAAAAISAEVPIPPKVPVSNDE